MHLSADREELQSRGLMGRGRWKGMLLKKLKYGLSTLFALFCTLSHVLGSSCPLPPWESLSSPLAVSLSLLSLAFPRALQSLLVSIPSFLVLLF